jgi:hypothetical protein
VSLRCDVLLNRVCPSHVKLHSRRGERVQTRRGGRGERQVDEVTAAREDVEFEIGFSLLRSLKKLHNLYN